MMVLRHIGPPSATVVTPPEDDDHDGDERTAIPMDLSNKHSVRHEVPRHCKNNNNSNNNGSNKGPLLSIFQSQNNNNNNNNISNNNKRTLSGKELLSLARAQSSPGSGGGDTRWRNEDDNSYSSPDSGLHRDSPGEDEDAMHGGRSPPLPLSLRHRQPLIPLSLIRARYNHNQNSHENDGDVGEDVDPDVSQHSTGSSNHPKDRHVQNKRARLEEMVSHIKKTTKPERSRRHSGDDDTSSGGQGTSGGEDEAGEDGPTDLRSESARSERSPPSLPSGKPFNLTPTQHSHLLQQIRRAEGAEDEPCNLVCMNKQASALPLLPDGSHFDPKTGISITPKNFPQISLAEASKLQGLDPEAYQQQMMQLQLTSAAMMGDPGGLLKAMGSYPPWVYLGYYSQLLHSFQAQEILRQYAIQSQTPTISQGEKSPPLPRTLGSSGYNCRSPVSPASVNEGPTAMDSDNSMAGQTTGGNGNGKRAPRAMTGRHVRTGTGASPTTLQTLRLKIEERQRMKAQQLRHDMMLQSHTSNNNNSKNKASKLTKKFKK